MMPKLYRAHELVTAARAEFEPGPADRERVRRALGAAFTSAGVAASTAVSSAANAAAVKGMSAFGGHSLLGLAKLLVGTVAVTVGAGTTLVVAARALSQPARVPRIETHAVETAHPRSPPAALKPSVREFAQSGAATVPARPATGSSKPTTSDAPPRSTAARQAMSPVATPATPPPSESLEAELGLLHEAKRALTNNDYGTALSVLGRLDREHPAGALLEEREALRVVLACRTSASSREQQAANFRARYPQSLYAARIDSACGPRAAAAAASTKSFTDPEAGGH